jgi:hypothetical protein
MFGKPTVSSGHPFLAIACFSASIFLLEVLLTRLFSVILFYHFAFVAISVGMLGLAAAGVRVALAPERFTAESAGRDIHAAALRYTPAAVVAILTRQNAASRLAPCPLFRRPPTHAASATDKAPTWAGTEARSARGTGRTASASSAGSGTAGARAIRGGRRCVPRHG